MNERIGPHRSASTGARARLEGYIYMRKRKKKKRIRVWKVIKKKKIKKGRIRIYTRREGVKKNGEPSGRCASDARQPFFLFFLFLLAGCTVALSVYALSAGLNYTLPFTAQRLARRGPNFSNTHTWFYSLYVQVSIYVIYQYTEGMSVKAPDFVQWAERVPESLDMYVSRWHRRCMYIYINTYRSEFTEYMYA